MDNYQAIFSGKPSYMSAAQYDSYVQSGQCARLLRGECSSPCSPIDENGCYAVDFDHIQPRSQGGDDSAWNVEPKCKSFNRWDKRDNPDPYFQRPSYFDQLVKPEALRFHQDTHAYGLVKNPYRELFARPSKEIQSVFMLLAWMVGSGKSIGMTAILHAINEVINYEGTARPRIYKVLWMVHQESLVKSICHEVENEPTDYGIIQSKPRVSVIEKSDQWNGSILQSDFVFACPQSLWGTKNSALTEIERASYLSKFDAIIIDEGHFAIDRYVEILQNAPRALKFVMTATPCDRDGKFLSQIENGKYSNLFRLFSVFGYSSALSHGYLKRIPSWADGLDRFYIPVQGGDSQLVESGQIVVGQKNISSKYNNPRANAILQTAIDIAESIKDYPCHIMARCGGITEIKALQKTIKEDCSRYFPPTKGWDVSSIYTGSPGVPVNDLNHPWMKVKKHKKLTNGNARLLLTVDMGQFGLNNPYCGVIAWVAINLSFIEIIQRIGRACRILPHIDSSEQYTYLVFSDDENVKQRLESAIEYIHTMEENIVSAFLPLGGDAECPEIHIPVPTVNLSLADKFDLNETYGVSMPEGLTKSEILDIAESLAKEKELSVQEVKEAIDDYIEKISDDTFKDRQFGLPKSAEPFTFVFEEECKDKFSIPEMERFARGRYDAETADNIACELSAKAPLITAMITSELKGKISLFHRPSSKYYRVQDLLGVNGSSKTPKGLDFKKDTYYGALKGLFPLNVLFDNSSDDERKQLREILIQNLYRACSYCFGLPGFSKNDYQGFESQLSSTMCSPLVRTRVLVRAKALCFNALRSRMPGHYVLYLNQIKRFLDGGDS